jgi:hypothetical protein
MQRTSLALQTSLALSLLQVRDGARRCTLGNPVRCFNAAGHRLWRYNKAWQCVKHSLGVLQYLPPACLTDARLQLSVKALEHVVSWSLCGYAWRCAMMYQHTCGTLGGLAHICSVSCCGKAANASITVQLRTASDEEARAHAAAFMEGARQPPHLFAMLVQGGVLPLLLAVPSARIGVAQEQQVWWRS